MAGVSFSREFGLDPYFTRNPGLHYSGAAATPSTMDVYVNGIFLRRVQLPPGQFELRDLPVPTGSADTRLVLRDAFGREQEITSPFYFTAGLLKMGLQEFSYNLGVEREDFATESWHYGSPVFLDGTASATNSLTAGLRLGHPQGCQRQSFISFFPRRLEIAGGEPRSRFSRRRRFSRLQLWRPII
jgi:outer membrane usher protein